MLQTCGLYELVMLQIHVQLHTYAEKQIRLAWLD